ncbi:inositol hexakisphosphate and diphosphoinositol-pentakisphosphate kinase [Thraustotheca clavata]|uniref:Inositol hexakisphosphate and diphosphoinositol-pentakisphosphate kinase n=1 Tax=Thraustotheca clavata TaxID=74557 RepID=A0A1W0A9S2_9STRA|nr:inositol hexakisphosphate and diphosphoinositol-pentakisphosphate kinase [Thraustotheca clavata]
MPPPCVARTPPPMSRKYVVGICAMEKKTKSKPMQEILRRLNKKKHFDLVVFTDDMILRQPVDAWPVCDALLSFYSTGFPLEKAESYVHLRRPVLVNDLSMQHILFDRRKVYEVLIRNGVNVPRHAIVNRDGPTPDILEESENHVIVNGVQINKPFVEKPANAEDHNIYIYYPTSAGGGSKRLFRKVGDRSSEFYPDVNQVRREGSYIYEEFLNTQGTDVKVYTVGPNYGHAEARKSPVLDGRVMRDSVGKEVRYPVILNSVEKDIARKVCLAFQQTVCGFDLLRVRGTSYVCDVNGWSFVKNSKKYYDDCGLVLHNYLLNALRYRSTRARPATSPRYPMSPSFSPPDPSLILQPENNEPAARDTPTNPPNLSSSHSSDPFDNSPANFGSPSFTHMSRTSSNASVEDLHWHEKKEELRAVIAIVVCTLEQRHGDRTPKQKLKTRVWASAFVDFYEKRRTKDKFDEVKVKAVKDLQELLDIVRNLIKEYAPNVGSKGAVWEKDGGDSFEKLLQIKRVLERWKFAGINRKVQFKPRREYMPPSSSSGANSELLLIMKWGGDLTETGKRQGEQLGNRFRNELYPVEEGGLLRLHSTFRHDLKIFTSDEGRVQMTAAAFAKGFLELEGDLTPILVSLVTTLDKDANKMLDHSGQADANEEIEKTKAKMRKLMHKEYSSADEFISAAAPLSTKSIVEALRKIQFPLESLRKLHDLIKLVKTEIKELGAETEKNAILLSDPTINEVYMGETLSLVSERWEKLYRDFYSAQKQEYDLSKIPDIYDCIKYDMLHNFHGALVLKHGRLLFELAECFVTCYVPQEYGLLGMDTAEKQSIGIKVSQALCAKIRSDIAMAMTITHEETAAVVNSAIGYSGKSFLPLCTDDPEEMDCLEHNGYRLDPSFAKELRIKSPGTQVRTRLYFTSESHMHTLLNVLRYQCPTWNERVAAAMRAPCSPQRSAIVPDEEEVTNRLLNQMGIGKIPGDGPNKALYELDPSKLNTPEALAALDNVTELDYLAHITIRVFEQPWLLEDDEHRFRVEIAFSPGVRGDPETNEIQRSASTSSMSSAGFGGPSPPSTPTTLSSSLPIAIPASAFLEKKDSIEIDHLYQPDNKIYLTNNMPGAMFDDMLATCIASAANTANIPDSV